MLPENWDAVQVYQRCQWQTGVGMGGVVYLGIEAAEIEAVARAHGTGFTFQLLDDVRIMTYAAARIRNRQRNSRMN